MKGKKNPSKHAGEGKAGKRVRSSSAHHDDRPSNSFPIVGVGASAGGLEAVTQLLEHLPADTGMAFVLVQHLAPGRESQLTDLLSRQTRMPVKEVQDRMEIEPNHIYVIPPDKNMTMSQGRLRLVPRVGNTAHMAIDFFLQSLARDRQHQAIGVILSGTATDGTLGLRAIKAEGGVTFAQDERSAKYDSMPRSAIASGAVDFVLRPADIARELERIGRHPGIARPEAAKIEGPYEGDGTDLEKLFALVRVRTGADFSHYKTGTVWRRIQRRMLLREARTLREYVQLLHRDPEECNALYDDILIHVTSFFRDPGTFEVLKKRIFPAMLKGREAEAPIRMWIPGCSTGEDAYSLVISLLEYLSDRHPGAQIQAFGTDLSEKAIQIARRGVYPETIAAQVSAARLKRFFTKTEHGYQINKSIRDAIVFAKHDVTRDPPYSRLDIVSCRNVLIFLSAAMQKNVFAALHYALKPTGYLVLGSSESVGEFSEFLSSVDRKHKIYSKRAGVIRLPGDFASVGATPPEIVAAGAALQSHTRAADLAREADRAVMEQYGPPGVVVNDELEVLQFRGHTGPYLDPIPGQATLNLLKIARGDLLYELRTAMQRVKKNHEACGKEGVRVKFNGATKRINLRILPIKTPGGGRRYYLVLFEPAEEAREPAHRAAPAALKAAKTQQDKLEILRLEQELKAAKEFLRSALEDHEAVNEELSTTNEELLSTNEELRTTNEELETAKEELQSTNEELSTLNDELQSRNQELAQAGNDLRNILSSIYGGVVVVDRQGRIRFLTAQAEKTLNLLPSDVGRPIGDIKPAVNIPDLRGTIASVIEGRAPQEIEASDAGQNWYTVRIQPYLAANKNIEGALIYLADVTGRKRAEEALRQGQEQFRTLVEGVRDYAIFMLDPKGHITTWNAGAERINGYAAEEVLGKSFSLFSTEEDMRQGRPMGTLKAAEARGRFESEGWRVRKDGSRFWANVVITPLRDSAKKLTGFVKFMRDATERKHAEDMTHQLSARRIKAQDDERQRVSRELHDTTGPSLAALVMNLAMVNEARKALDPKARQALRESLALAKQCAEEIRTVAYQLHPPLLDEEGLEAGLRWYVESFSKLSGIKVETKLAPRLGRLPKDLEIAMFRVIQEALINVHRHSDSPTAEIKLDLNTNVVSLEVKDHGKGMSEGAAEGIGLRGVRERVDELGGQVEIESSSQGTTLKATFPITGGGQAKGGMNSR